MVLPDTIVLRKHGFTVIELVVVLSVLGILAAVAIPRYVNLMTEARLSSRDAVIGAVRTGLELAHMRYITGDTAGLPPDANGDNYPDHLGDLAAGELTLFDAILATPIPYDEYGWKADEIGSFPMGTLYVYVYDASGSGGMNVSGEATIVYDSSNGNLYKFSIP